MNNEIRNELLGILNLVKSDNKKFELSYLLEKFEYDIKGQLEDLEHKKEQLQDDLEVLDYVRKEIEKEQE